MLFDNGLKCQSNFIWFDFKKYSGGDIPHRLRIIKQESFSFHRAAAKLIYKLDHNAAHKAYRKANSKMTG